MAMACNGTDQADQGPFEEITWKQSSWKKMFGKNPLEAFPFEEVICHMQGMPFKTI